MLKHILVPLDGSDVAEHALKYACAITDTNGGTITLLTALDIPDYTVNAYYPSVVAYGAHTEDLTQKMLPQAKDYLSHTAESLKRAGYHVTLEAVIGEPASTIVEKAEELKVDAVVMSTHGRSGISRWLFGSVAAKVLGSTTCPAFIVPVRK